MKAQILKYKVNRSMKRLLLIGNGSPSSVFALQIRKILTIEEAQQIAPLCRMAEKEDLTVSLASALVEQLRGLAMLQERTLPKLVEEAIQDLLRKYEKKGKK